jgi:hypothetical protein
LAAQKGLFVLDRYPSHGYEGLEDKILDYVQGAKKCGAIAEGELALRKFSLRRSECSDLLDLLSRLGIDRAHLMPSFSGVVEELKARRDRRTAH